MTRTIVIDGQIFQTGALYRGMGVLTIEMLLAAKKLQPGTDFRILLNNKISTSRSQLNDIHDSLPGFIIDTLRFATPAHGSEESAQKSIEDYITSLNVTDVSYVMPALFLFDYHAALPTNARTVMIFHDLIPLVMWEHLKNVFPGDVYFPRFSKIYQCDTIVSNSHNTKHELINLLGVNPEKIFVMGGAPEVFTSSEQEQRGVLNRLGIDYSKPFVLLPSGGGHMHHKNNQVAAEALYLLDRVSDADFNVVATSNYEEDERQMLTSFLGDKVVFTGGISTPNMRALYQSCSVVLVPSLAEGLGIPVLNAIALDKPVVCSNIPVFDELADGRDVFYSFDPHDPWDLQDNLLAAFAQAGFEAKRKNYAALRRQYTWRNCAQVFLKACFTHRLTEGVHASHSTTRIEVLMPDPLAEKTLGYVAQSFAALTRNNGDNLFVIDSPQNPVPYDDRGADFVRVIADTINIKDYSPQVGKNTRKLVFLSPDANFANLHMFAGSLEGHIVYISDNVSEHTYHQMARAHLIDSRVANEQTKAHAVLSADGYFGSPEALLRARGVIVEKRAVKRVKKTLRALGNDCPVMIVDNMMHDQLGEYVHGAERRIAIVSKFMEDVYGKKSITV